MIQPEQKKNIGIKIVGVLIIILGVIATLGGLANSIIIGIVQGILILTAGFLLVKMKRLGFYILTFLFFLNFSSIFRTDNQSLMGLIVVLVIHGGIVIYIWSQRGTLT